MHGNPQQTFLAYIAGLIDGEGSIMITKTVSKKSLSYGNRRNPIYLAVVRCGMNDKRPLDFILNVTGLGEIYKESIRKDREHHKTMFRWRVSARPQVTKFLNLIKPYLILKKPQCDHCLEFIKKWKTPFNRHNGTDPEELQRREEAYQKMRKFNSLGVAATTESLSTEK